MKLVYFASSGTGDATRATLPFGKLPGSWVSPPDVARLFAEADRVVTF